MKKIYTIVFGISAVLTLAALVAFAAFGLRLGVDFSGGSVLELKFSAGRPSVEEIKNTLSTIEPLANAEINFAGTDGVIIRGKQLTEEEHQKARVALGSAFQKNMVQEERFDSVGPVVGSELKTRSLTAIVLLLAVIAAYIALVFRKMSRTLSPWIMSIATMIALSHDIIIPLGLFAVLGHFFHVEIGAVFVAAILTILGYSITDTVVVFDRVRENIIRGTMAKEPFPVIVHKSILQTLVRSLNATGTTLVSLVAIFIFGGDSIRYFALALIVGIGLGAYSSIFIASPLLVWLSRKK